MLSFSLIRAWHRPCYLGRCTAESSGLHLEPGKVPDMTKRHFEMIAKAIEAQSRIQYAETALQATRLQTLTDVAEQIAQFCTNENPRFDRDRFLTACGLQEGGR